MDSDVMSLSLQGPKQVMIQSALYFEEKGLVEKAVMLYMKGKQLKKAMRLA
jgi:intraflagellar transport protein 140